MTPCLTLPLVLQRPPVNGGYECFRAVGQRGVCGRNWDKGCVSVGVCAHMSVNQFLLTVDLS